MSVYNSCIANRLLWYARTHNGRCREWDIADGRPIQALIDRGLVRESNAADVSSVEYELTAAGWRAAEMLP